MPDPRPNHEPRPRVEPQQSPSRPLVPDRVVGIVALVLGVALLVTFAVRLATSIGGTWLDTWWPLVAGFAFVALGAQRVRRSRH